MALSQRLCLTSKTCFHEETYSKYDLCNDGTMPKILIIGKDFEEHEVEKIFGPYINKNKSLWEKKFFTTGLVILFLSYNGHLQLIVFIHYEC